MRRASRMLSSKVARWASLRTPSGTSWLDGGRGGVEAHRRQGSQATIIIIIKAFQDLVPQSQASSSGRNTLQNKTISPLPNSWDTIILTRSFWTLNK